MMRGNRWHFSHCLAYRFLFDLMQVRDLKVVVRVPDLTNSKREE